MLKTPADWITAARFALAFVLFGVLVWIERQDPAARPGIALAAVALFVVAALTDMLDGYVARRTGTSDFGRVADPFVDKVLVVGTLVFLAAIRETREIVPAWAVVVIVAREFLVTGVRGYVESRGVPFPADWFGKWKMALQCVAAGLGLLVLAEPARWKDSAGLAKALGQLLERTLAPLTAGLVLLTVLLTVASGVSYVLRARRLLRGAR